MREIELVSWKDVAKRVENIKKSLEDIYEVKLSVEFEKIPLNNLYPTEEFLEKDKLALIFMKVIMEGYNVPIVAVKHGEEYFILDGHHRSYISKKLMKETIRAYVLKFPRSKSYRARPKRPLKDLPIKDVAAIDDPILRTWGQILTLLKYYEALYSISFNLRKEKAPLMDLIPTQPQIRKEQIDLIKELLVPIVCIKHQGKFYILDGHARSLRAMQLGLESVQAIILFPEVEIDFGIIKAAREMNLENLGDIKIVDYS